MAVLSLPSLLVSNIPFTVPFFGFAFLPTVRRDPRGLFQYPSRVGSLEFHFNVGQRRSITGKLSYHGIVRFVEPHKISFGGLTVGKARGIAKSESDKQRIVRPVAETGIPSLRIAYNINKSSIGITVVNGI